MDKGTIIRTAALFIALVNQCFVLAGKSPLPIDSELVENFLAAFLTIVTSIIAWYKNNYITKVGKKQKEALQEKGLIKQGRKKDNETSFDN